METRRRDDRWASPSLQTFDETLNEVLRANRVSDFSPDFFDLAPLHAPGSADNGHTRSSTGQARAFTRSSPSTNSESPQYTRQTRVTPPIRDIVFCHQCENEWYRDEGGLVCPECGSDYTEIVVPGDNDPRSRPVEQNHTPGLSDVAVNSEASRYSLTQTDTLDSRAWFNEAEDRESPGVVNRAMREHWNRTFGYESLSYHTLSDGAYVKPVSSKIPEMRNNVAGNCHLSTALMLERRASRNDQSLANALRLL
jgi:hypothetical protein